MEVNKIYQGNALEVLKTFPSESINCVITSPPYWALRDYQTEGIIWDGDENCEHEFEIIEKKNPMDRGGKGQHDIGGIGGGMGELTRTIVKSGFCSKCRAWKGSLGLEPTFDLFIKHLCDIFDEVKRVLRKDGTCWVNIGDTYGQNYRGGKEDTEDGYAKRKGNRYWQNEWGKNKKPTGLPDKSLCLIPFRFAIEMVNRGWILRNVIIWHKPFCMPSSAKDRFTVDFEHIFFFVKNKKYWFETQYEDYANSTKNDNRYGNMNYIIKPFKQGYENSLAQNPKWKEKAFRKGLTEGRNKRTVWTINPQPFSETICLNCGYFDKLETKEEKEGYFGGENKIKSVCKVCGSERTTSHFAIFPEKLIETPLKSGCPKGGTVLDPFLGSGTTGIVALKQSKRFVGIELNSIYVKMAQERLKPYLFQQKL